MSENKTDEKKISENARQINELASIVSKKRKNNEECCREFDELYKLLTARSKNIVLHRFGKADEAVVCMALNDVMMKAFRSFDPDKGDFTPFYERSFLNEYRRLFASENRYDAISKNTRNKEDYRDDGRSFEDCEPLDIKDRNDLKENIRTDENDDPDDASNDEVLYDLDDKEGKEDDDDEKKTAKKRNGKPKLVSIDDDENDTDRAITAPAPDFDAGILFEDTLLLIADICLEVKNNTKLKKPWYFPSFFTNTLVYNALVSDNTVSADFIGQNDLKFDSAAEMDFINIMLVNKCRSVVNIPENRCHPLSDFSGKDSDKDKPCCDSVPNFLVFDRFWETIGKKCTQPNFTQCRNNYSKFFKAEMGKKHLLG